MECYDFFLNRWTEVVLFKEVVSFFVVISCIGKLFVIGGGFDDNICFDKVRYMFREIIYVMYKRER